MRNPATLRWSLLAVLALLASCESRQGARLELSVGSADSQVINYVQRILYARLRDAAGGRLADVRTAYFAELDKLVFEIAARAPDEVALRYLYETRGDYRVYVTDENGKRTDWITNRDIVAADAGRARKGPTVFVGLGPEATRRVKEVSADQVGTTIRSSLDGELIYETTLTWPMGRFYQFEVGDLAEARMLAVVLRHGVLPAAVTRWEGGTADPVAAPPAE